MITVEIKINGIIVGCIYAINKGKNHCMPDHCNYKFEYWRPGEGAVTTGTLLHKTVDGADALVKSILHAVRPYKEDGGDAYEEN